MSEHRFAQVDVFSAVPLRGNPVAVVFDAAGLGDARMQDFARWTNLSETTFLLPPTDAAADYRLRIFTPGGELPFAGHPTLGSCHAWLEAGGVPSGDEAVTGSLNAGLAQWLIGAGLAPARYVASQGTRLGRAGRVHVQRLADTVWIGGDSVTCIAGSLSL